MVDKGKLDGQGGTALQEITKARQALARAQDIYQVLEIRDIAKAASVYAEAQDAGEAANEAKEVQLRAERKAGAFLKELERSPLSRGGDTTAASHSVTPPSEYAEALETTGVNRQTAHRWQKVAEVPDEEFEGYIQDKRRAGDELTQAGVLRLAKKQKPHVSHNSGNNEWYTPPEFIKAAREVLGGIDLDPASSARANSVIDAATFYTAEDDGLEKEWYGRVWMNPPYASDLVGKFTSKLAWHFREGDVSAAVVLINNATETAWFRVLIDVASAVVFPESRVKFWRPDGERGAPLQGQAIIYLGGNPRAFLHAFKEFGWGALIDG